MQLPLSGLTSVLVQTRLILLLVPNLLPALLQLHNIKECDNSDLSRCQRIDPDHVDHYALTTTSEATRSASDRLR